MRHPRIPAMIYAYGTGAGEGGGVSRMYRNRSWSAGLADNAGTKQSDDR